MRKIVFVLAMVCCLAACHKPQNGREQLLNRLDSLQQRGCMFGHQDDPFYGIGWAYEDGRSDVLETCGDYPAVMGFELGGIEMGDCKNLDSVPFDRMRQEIIRHHQRGGIVTISWHPRNPLTVFDSDGKEWPAGTAWDATDGVVATLLEGGENHELFLTWLERVRAFLSSLTDEQGQPIPFIFRPWHENNGTWFWWGYPHCTPAEYRALYALTQDYIQRLTTNEQRHILWSYSPNLDGNMTEDKFLQWYPGDERIDLIGLDAYQWGTEEDYVRQTRADLDCLCAFAAQHGKQIALTECGYRSIPDPTWWHRVLLPIINDYPLSYTLVWRNAEGGEHFGPVPGTDCGREFLRLYNDPHTLFLKDINQ